MDYTFHGILQARILEWAAFPFSRGSFPGTEHGSRILELSERSESCEQQSCPPSSFCGRKPREREENGKRGWLYGGGEPKKEGRIKLKITRAE